MNKQGGEKINTKRQKVKNLFIVGNKESFTNFSDTDFEYCHFWGLSLNKDDIENIDEWKWVDMSFWGKLKCLYTLFCYLFIY